MNSEEQNEMDELRKQLENVVSTLNRKEEMLASVKSELEKEVEANTRLLGSSLKRTTENNELRADNKRLRDVVDGILGLKRYSPCETRGVYLFEQGDYVVFVEIQELIASLERGQG